MRLSFVRSVQITFGARGQLEEVALAAEVADRPVLGVVDAEAVVPARRTGPRRCARSANMPGDALALGRGLADRRPGNSRRGANRSRGFTLPGTGVSHGRLG